MPPQERLHPRDQHGGVEGLLDVVIRPECQTSHLILVAAPRRDDQDRARRGLAENATDLEAADAGQAQIEEHQVGLVLAKGVERGLAVRYFDRGMACSREVGDLYLADSRFIFNDEDRHTTHI